MVQRVKDAASSQQQLRFSLLWQDPLPRELPHAVGVNGQKQKQKQKITVKRALNANLEHFQIRYAPHLIP